MRADEQSSEQSNSFLNFQEGFQEEFTFYQKHCDETYKSRACKRKERVLKLTKHLHDPEQKKLRKKQQRKIQKDKLHQAIEHMTPEQARVYLDTIKRNKAQAKQKVRQAMSHGQVFLIDMVFEQKMNEKEKKSLGKQIELIMKVIKWYKQPPSIHICQFQGYIKQKLEKMGYQHWAVTTHPEGILEVGDKLDKKLVYLSPDAELEVESIEKDTAYIIGGLVDRSVLKNASLDRARELGIQARKLPISHLMKGRLCLNLDHVVNMMCKFVECKNWKEAFAFAAPLRWKKQQKQSKQPEKKEEAEHIDEAEKEQIDPFQLIGNRGQCNSQFPQQNIPEQAQ